MPIHARRSLTVLLTLAAFGCSDDTSTVDSGSDSTLVDSAAMDSAPDTRLHDIPGLQEAQAPDGPGDQALADSPQPTGDAAAFPKCTANGGICTPQRWVVCPINTEPIHPDPHQDCGQGGSGGWCCVPAPASTCSAAASVNCVFGTKCSGCWAAPADTSLTCEAGRVCCEDICD